MGLEVTASDRACTSSTNFTTFPSSLGYTTVRPRNVIFLWLHIVISCFCFASIEYFYLTPQIRGVPSGCHMLPHIRLLFLLKAMVNCRWLPLIFRKKKVAEKRRRTKTTQQQKTQNGAAVTNKGYVVCADLATHCCKIPIVSRQWQVYNVESIFHRGFLQNVSAYILVFAVYSRHVAPFKWDKVRQIAQPPPLELDTIYVRNEPPPTFWIATQNSFTTKM